MSAHQVTPESPREAGISEGENEANALLIAAAPELADALEELLVYVPGQIGDKARAALKKAGRLP